MTCDEYNDIKILQDDVDREIITLKALIPNPRMLEIFSLMAWRADPDEEEQSWIILALSMARRIREYQEHQSCPIRA